MDAGPLADLPRKSFKFAASADGAKFNASFYMPPQALFRATSTAVVGFAIGGLGEWLLQKKRAPRLTYRVDATLDVWGFGANAAATLGMDASLTKAGVSSWYFCRVLLLCGSLPGRVLQDIYPAAFPPPRE